ncbi:putative transporter slc-17.2 [Halotydeus destructor]|nr:putative transporter slc-17.2 [Halotydeus destructor]
MLITANTVSYVTRVNLNLAIVSMVSHKVNITDSAHEVCPLPSTASSSTESDSTETTAPQYDWDLTTQNLILGAFYYPYVALQIPSGRMAEIFGSKYIITLGLLGSGLVNLLTPLAATSVLVMTLTRILIGIFQAGIYPATILLCKKWFPANEVSTAVGLQSFGTSMGSFLSSILTGYLSEYGFSGGWPSVFYVSGVIGVLQSLLFMILVANTAEESTRVSITELEIIIKDKKPTETKSSPPVPWVKIFTSAPVWAYFLARFLLHYGYFMVSVQTPKYMSDILQVKPTKNGIINGLIYLAACSTLATTGGLSEKMVAKGYMSRTNLCPGLDVAPWRHLSSSLPATFFYGFASGGMISLATELTSNFVATLVGICNTLSIEQVKVQMISSLKYVEDVLKRVLRPPRHTTEEYNKVKQAILLVNTLMKHAEESSRPELRPNIENNSSPEQLMPPAWEERFAKLEQMVAASCSQRSYSHVAQQNIQRPNSQAPPAQPPQAVPTLTLKLDCLDDANLSANGLKQTIIDSIPARNGDAGVDRMRLLGQKSLLIVTRDEESKAYLEAQIKDKLKHICKIGQPFYKMPTVRVEGLHNSDSKEELKEHLDRKFPEYSDKIKVVLLHKIKGGNQQAAIVRVPKELYSEMMKEPELYFKYSRLKLAKHTHVTICYKCQMYGHISANCHNKEHCSHCAGEHASKNCPHRSDMEHIACAVCQQFNAISKTTKPFNHRCHTHDCPHHKKALDNTEAQTEYQR